MILFRYITKGLPRPFFYSLMTITMIFMMMISVRLLPRVMGRGIPTEIILQLLGLKMIAYLALAVPLAMLVSTLMVFGRLSSDNEYTAIKAAGIGLRQLLPPIIAVGLLVSVILGFFNSTILPESNVRGQQLYRDIMKTKPAALIKPGVLIHDFPGYAIMVDSVDHGKGKLFDITIFADEKDQTPSVTVADSGTLFLTDDEQELELTLYNGETVTDGTKKNSGELYKIEFMKQVLYFDNPARDFDKSTTMTKDRNDREMTTKQLLVEVKKSEARLDEQKLLHTKRINELLSFYDTLTAVTSSYHKSQEEEQKRLTDSLVADSLSLVALSLDSTDSTLAQSASTAHTPDVVSIDSGSLDSAVLDSSAVDSIVELTNFPLWFHSIDPKARRRSAREFLRREQHIARIRSSRIERASLKLNSDLVEVHKKFALALSALVFAILGVSFGIVGRSGSVAISIIYAALVYIVNYIFLIGGESLANHGVVSAKVAMWSGDIFLGLFAIFLIIRSSRDTGGLINFPRIGALLARPFRPIVNLFFSSERVQEKRAKRAEKKAVLEKALRKQSLFSKIIEFVSTIPRRILHFFLPTLEAYLLGRFLNFFVILLGSLIMLFSVLDYVGNINSFRGALPMELVDYYKSFVVAFLPMILPISILLAVMMSIGSFAKKQEITAIKAGGINMIRVTLPFVVFGVLISGGNFWFNEQMVGKANASIELYHDVFSARRNNRPIPTEIKTYRRNFYYFNGRDNVFRFTYFQTQPPRADRVIYFHFDKNRLSSVTNADKMVYDSSWTLIDGRKSVLSEGKITVEQFEELPMDRLEQTPEEMVKEVKKIELMSYSELHESMELAKQRGESTDKYLADLYFKFALPLMNLIVILIGVAVTAKSGKRGGAVNFGVGILLAFSYWAVAQFLLLFGRSGTIDPLIAAWGGTVFFLILGVLMYRRAAQ